MKQRTLLIGLVSAALFTTGLSSAILPALADTSHTATVVEGRTITVDTSTPTTTVITTQTATAPASTSTATTPATTVADAPAQTSTAPEAPTPAATTPTEPAAPPETTPVAPAEETPADAAPVTTTEAPAPDATTPAPVTTTTTAAPTITAPVTEQPAGTKTRRPAKAQADIESSDPADTGSSATDVAPVRQADGTPTTADPTFMEALPGPAPIGVPNFFIEKFRIPPFLLPIYQAAGIQYGIRWELLAAINEIETDYGRNLNVSTAGALGWMQFMPATWALYGVDANKDGEKDPYNPVDAIFATARYLKAAGADTDVRRGIFAYNHADWYVDSVLLRARLISGMPTDLVGSLTGLTQGRFPVAARATYADGLSARTAARRVAAGHNAALPVESKASRRGVDIFAKAGSPVVATQDGRIVRIGWTKRLGRFVKLRDVYGNTYTYAHLAKIARAYPVPKARSVSKAAVRAELDLPGKDPKPTRAATAGTQPDKRSAATATATPDATPAKERVFAHPARAAAFKAGGEEQLLNADFASGATTFNAYFSEAYGLDRSDVRIERLEEGAKVIAGTILGRIGKTNAATAPHLRFEIRPAGRYAPRIDPKPILDGWKLLESTAIYRAKGTNPLSQSGSATIGQILLMGKSALEQRVLDDPRIEIYECGRRDIEAGQIDRRVLATLEFLAASGLKPTVSSLTCGHGYLTTSGNVSEHSTGTAVDIAAVNGIPISGHQGAGSITDITIRRLLTLQGTMKPHQIISLMTFDGADNTLSMPDHADHIHVGFRPLDGTSSDAATLKPAQWTALIDRIGSIANPTVATSPSKYSIQADKQARESTGADG